jgi:hypothetical protein
MPEVQHTVAAPPEPCVRCGADANFEIAALWLCIDCYHIAGSTCAGVGRIPATAPGTGAEPGAGEGATIGPADQVC